MARDYHVHTYSNGNVAKHENGGVLYIMKRVQDEESDVTVAHYNNLLNSAISSEECIEEIKKELIDGITTGNWSKRTLHALVRHGSQDHWRYFPVPLLFEDDETIRKQSEERGYPTRSIGWYRRKRNLVLKIVGFPEIP
ncbi:hypothetical protein D3C81_1656050 [compost metagenome]